MISISFASAAEDAETLDDRLDAFVREERLAGAALAVMAGDKIVYAGASGCAHFEDGGAGACARDLTPETKMRVASVSKMAAAMTAMRLVEEGALDIDRDVSDYLGWELRHPDYPEKPITARQLMSHTSSIRDPETYWVAAPGAFRDFIENTPEVFATPDVADRSPGAFFKYANLNYGILAAVIEKASGLRFDKAATKLLLAPADIDAGFNWSGAPMKARRRGATLYRYEDGQWRAQTDDAEVLSSRAPHFLAAEDIDRRVYLKNYSMGENPTLFSPQGGLRASVVGLAQLVRKLSEEPFAEASTAIWRFDPQDVNGDTENGFYKAYGLGVQKVEGADAMAPGRVLLGHAGEAYGLYSGAWLISTDSDAQDAEEISFAFAVTGASETPSPGAHPSFNAVEEKLVRLAFSAAGVSDANGGIAKPAAKKEKALDIEKVAHNEDEPRPFDASRSAMLDVDAALASIAITGKKAVLVLGGNWCHDSRGLAAKFETPALAQLLQDHYELVYVDVGRRDRNLDVARRFGVDELIGTPTVLIISSEGDLLNADSVHDWRTAYSRPLAEAEEYFRSFANSK